MLAYIYTEGPVDSLHIEQELGMSAFLFLGGTFS
jgi:hypothetical protein